MAPPTARGSPIAAAPAPPRTVAWRGVLRAAISTRWGQWCAAQRHSNAILGPSRRWGGQPLRSAPRPPFFGAAVLCVALWTAWDEGSAKFRRPVPSSQTNSKSREGEVYGFRPCKLRVRETSNVTNFATLRPHPEDTARRFARSKTVPATRIKAAADLARSHITVADAPGYCAHAAFPSGRRRGSLRAR